jgi:hypothetical protein
MWKGELSYHINGTISQNKKKLHFSSLFFLGFCQLCNEYENSFSLPVTFPFYFSRRKIEIKFFGDVFRNIEIYSLMMMCGRLRGNENFVCF